MEDARYEFRSDRNLSRALPFLGPGDVKSCAAPWPAQEAALAANGDRERLKAAGDDLPLHGHDDRSLALADAPDVVIGVRVLDCAGAGCSGVVDRREVFPGNWAPTLR